MLISCPWCYIFMLLIPHIVIFTYDFIFARSCSVQFYVFLNRDSEINNTTPNFRWQVQLLLMLEAILKHFNS